MCIRDRRYGVYVQHEPSVRQFTIQLIPLQRPHQDIEMLDTRFGQFMRSEVFKMCIRDRFVGGVTDENRRTVTLPFDYLDPGKEYVATLYACLLYTSASWALTMILWSAARRRA